MKRSRTSYNSGENNLRIRKKLVYMTPFNIKKTLNLNSVSTS